jgi:hypothetical protein
VKANRGLVPIWRSGFLLETASVRHASENSGNELGVVHVAEAGRNIWFLSLKSKSTRVSKALRCSNEFRGIGEIRKATTELVGPGYNFISAMAFGSRREVAIWFRPQAGVKLAVLAAGAEGVANDSPVDVAVKPDTGSTAPAVTGRVVAGS